MNSLIKTMGTIGAGVVLTLAFIACGGGDSKETALQNKVKQNFNSHLLNFNEAQKEVGLKDSECLKEQKDKDTYNEYRFIKTSNGDIEITVATITSTSDTVFISKSALTLDELKAKKPECFN